MAFQRFFGFQALCFLFLFATPQSLFAKSKRSSVVDLYLDAPSKLLNLFNDQNGDPIPQASKLNLIQLKDLKNGYLQISPKGIDALEGPLTITKFNLMTSGRSLLAFAGIFGDRTETLVFLEKKAGKWQNVTSSVIPKIDVTYVDDRARSILPELRSKKMNLTDCASGTFRYRLPRYGTTIQAHVSSDCVKNQGELLFTLQFDKKTFQLDPAPKIKK